MKGLLARAKQAAAQIRADLARLVGGSRISNLEAEVAAAKTSAVESAADTVAAVQTGLNVLGILEAIRDEVREAAGAPVIPGATCATCATCACGTTAATARSRWQRL